MFLTAILPAVLVALTLAHIPHLNKQQISQKIANTKINYGSTVRLKASAFNF